jgi:ribosome biogenesis GTPase
MRFSALVQAPGFCARVVAQDRNSYEIANQELMVRAELSGRFRYENTEPTSHPAVGDYVCAAIAGGTAVIESVLPRDNLFCRRAGNGSHIMQPLAANIDTLFIVMSANRDFNLRRLERYLVAASACRVACAVILSKIDLAGDPPSFIEPAQYVAGGGPVLALSSLSGSGMEKLAPYRGEDRTIAFVGSSGAGKSTLINALLQRRHFQVSEIRESDGRGRHTTTRRCLVHLSDGTAVIDTPGMREFALADAEDDIEAAFADLEQLAQDCRFRDCKHEGEPGCAVIDRVNQARLKAGASWRGRPLLWRARATVLQQKARDSDGKP